MELNEEQSTLLRYLLLADALGNSVREDIESDKGVISAETFRALNKFKLAAMEANYLLDIAREMSQNIN
jgi:hypothetical protein